MSGKAFFEEMEEQSRVKAAIVAKYFRAWANVMISTIKRYGYPPEIAYIDLFAGRGRYSDGTESTPLIVLRQAIADADLSQMLMVLLNDKDKESVARLRKEIEALPSVGILRHKPQVLNLEVGEDIAKSFENAVLAPSLVFIDPWGYKGLSLRLIKSVVKDWGCDCVFFFNYNRINMNLGLSNAVVRQHLDDLLGKDQAEALRSRLERMDASERELAILETLCESIRALGARYVLPFRFRRPQGGRTSHHLVFVSKDFTGYDIMKGIMARSSSGADESAGFFEYNAANKNQPLLFGFQQSADELGESLVNTFAGQRKTMRQIYEGHSVGTPFIRADYAKALDKLADEGRIDISRPSGKKRRKGTFPDDIVVSFPAMS